MKSIEHPSEHLKLASHSLHLRCYLAAGGRCSVWIRVRSFFSGCRVWKFRGGGQNSTRLFLAIEKYISPCRRCWNIEEPPTVWWSNIIQFYDVLWCSMITKVTSGKKNDSNGCLILQGDSANECVDGFSSETLPNFDFGSCILSAQHEGSPKIYRNDLKQRRVWASSFPSQLDVSKRHNGELPKQHI